MMTLESLIDQFCSRSIAHREQTENVRALDITGCSRRSRCSRSDFTEVDLKVLEFVERCCEGFNIEPMSVMDGLLDEENKKEILREEISEEVLRVFIGMWIGDGCPNCNY